MTQAFIVGTGRCGSTTISNFLNRHSDALSLSEFFAHVTDLGGDTARAFPPHPITGNSFWDLLASPLPGIQSTIAQCGRLPEWLYPVHAPSPEIAPKGRIPPILLTTLPHLTANYEALFLELQDHIRSASERPARLHYLDLFTLLAQRFGKRGWIERSGGNLHLTSELAGLFPDARFLHIVRDGRKTALSMARHPAFRHRTGLPPLSGANPTPKDLGFFGRLWSNQIIAGIQSLQILPSDRLLTVRFEKFLREPESAIRTIERFLDIECDHSPETIEHFADRAIPEPALDARALAALDEACGPGYIALGANRPTTMALSRAALPEVLPAVDVDGLSGDVG